MSANDPYAGADRRNATRIVAFLWLLSGVLTLAYLPLDPPTDAIGDAGWIVAGVMIAFSFGAGVWLLRRTEPVSFDVLLLVSYFGVAQVALLQWLAGGIDAPYQNLYLIWIGSVMGIHPLKRALPFLVIALAVPFGPLLYESQTSSDVESLAANVMLWALLGAVMLALMSAVRAQRLKLAAEEEAAQQIARADALTSLGNRRAFDEALEVEIARARRAESTVTVALIDLDDFKQLNDAFGHLEGDRCLREVAATIADGTRGGDRAFRWGGDELALLLPDTPFEQAERALDRLAASVASGCFDPSGHPLTVSWGVAELDQTMTAADLLQQTDLALMAAKHRRDQSSDAGSRISRPRWTPDQP